MRFPAATFAALVVSAATLSATYVDATETLIYPNKPYHSYQTQDHGKPNGDRTKEGYLLGHGYMEDLTPDGFFSGRPGAGFNGNVDFNRNGIVNGASGSKSSKSAKGPDAAGVDVGVGTRTDAGNGAAGKSPKSAKGEGDNMGGGNRTGGAGVDAGKSPKSAKGEPGMDGGNRTGGAGVDAGKSPKSARESRVWTVATAPVAQV